MCVLGPTESCSTLADTEPFAVQVSHESFFAAAHTGKDVDHGVLLEINAEAAQQQAWKPWSQEANANQNSNAHALHNAFATNPLASQAQHCRSKGNRQRQNLLQAYMSLASLTPDPSAVNLRRPPAGVPCSLGALCPSLSGAGVQGKEAGARNRNVTRLQKEP